MTRSARPNVCRVFALVLAFALLATACGGDEETGDLEAFCDLVETGVGVSSAGQSLEASEFDELAAVAPPEVIASVRKLGNSTRDLDELTSEASLEELFDAAFDPSAVEAQDNFFAYVNSNCTVDLEALAAGPSGEDQDLVADLRAYVDGNFASQVWVSKVRFDLEERGLRGDNILVTFIIAPDADDEPMAACEIVSAYLYDVAAESGAVVVLNGKDTVVQRSGPDAGCNAR